ncbi:MAG TPA: methyltransferase domain-containing protein [Gemmatimonadales bacterium]|nr:methyltransferase domain-containing protein [Gemmatimonadales bacterium]
MLLPRRLRRARRLIDVLQEWARRRRELFDDPAADASTVVASLRDIARANRYFGGAAAAVSRLDEFFRAVPPGAALTLLDVGTGDGDIPRAAQRRAATRGIRLRVLGLERHHAAARLAARDGMISPLLGDAHVLPLRAASVDLVLCSQLLHHFRGAALAAAIAELSRVAGLGVVVADLLPSPVAALGFWLAGLPLRFHPVTRRDGFVSVLRGFTPAALHLACREAGVEARVRTHPGFRVTAAWAARPPGGRA